jgi:hypothetical protein
VFHEFGDDALEHLKTPQTEARVIKNALNPSLSIFVAVKSDPAKAGS